LSAFQINNLDQLSRGGESRSSVELPDVPSFLCEKIVRRVPGRRLVCQGTWGQHAVYAKIFIGENSAKYLARDKQGVNSLLQAGIVTPAILFAGLSRDGKAHIMLLEAIDDATNAEVCWRSLALDSAQRLQLATNLVTQVVEHHRAALLQTDLYLKNFLVQNDKIYTLDGDGIRRLSGLFQKRQRLRNLATLFSKMDVLDDVWIPELYAHYCKQLGTAYSLTDETDVWTLTQKIRRQVACDYADKKVFRSCTDVKVIRSFKRYVAIASDFGVEDSALQSLDLALVDKSANLKNGNTCTIAKMAIANWLVVIKRYNIKNVWHGLNRAFRMSRAARSWANTYRLIISDIATHKPLALIEERLGCLRGRAYFLSEYMDAPDVSQYFSQSISLSEKEAVAHKLATLFYKLYLLKITHGDCKASNIKIVDGSPVLIDLDGMKAHSLCWLANPWFERQHVKDLKRLIRNWSGDVEIASMLKLAFVQKYTEFYPYEQNDILFRAGIS